jgi:hypothetical protein
MMSLSLGAFTESQASISFVMSVCLSGCISATPIGHISMKFGTGEFYENLSGKSEFG